MKKRIFAIVMAVIMIATLVAGAIPALAANDLITVRLHYHREDGNYEGWEMWFWDLDGISSLNPPYAFEDIDGEKVATIQVKPGTTRIGYIVRQPDWTKDVEHDQFINITGVLAGTVDFYVESGVASQPNKDAIPTREELQEKGLLKLGSDVELGVVITANRYDVADSNGNPRVVLQMSSELDYDANLKTFSVFNKDGSVAITECKKVGQYYYLILAEQLDLSRSYNVGFEGREYALTMPDYYSNAEFEDKFTYTGNDLGATYSAAETKLRVWAPTAVEVMVNLYSNGDPAAQPTPVEQVPMTADVNGTWVATLSGDRNGTYYTYTVTTDTEVNEACDPYARTTGVNGHRAMIIDLAATNPEGWDTDKDPHYDNNFTDAVIWELHVRDLSSDPSSGISAANVGKYLGLIETGTKNSHGQSTGLDYIKDLGVTHIHLLPVYDFGSVNETKLDTPQFNWGYDPVNYNVPEGSYSTNPYDGKVRVEEFKQMVKGLHDNGLSVIMDVVYNHVYNAEQFCFNKIVPDYFTRPGANGSGCGNDTASERNMVSKYIIDSVTYWADEYHIDGFRFDLVGLLDTNTINGIIESVHKNHPNVKFYGEGWELGTVTTKNVTLATMFNSTKTPEFAFFSDSIRNTLKGGTFGGVNPGFISGASVSAGDMNSLFMGMPSWCKTPSQSINYISCHDNNTLYDHISLVKKDATKEQKAAMNKLGVAFYMSAQGIPFMQAGEEIMRSKPDASKEGGFNENSYNATDAVNSIKWDTLNEALYQDVHDYYKGLIAFRKAHPALRLTNSADVKANVTALSGLDANVVAYQINGGVNGEKSEGIVAIFNANADAKTITLPEGTWNICVNAQDAGTTSLGTATGSVSVDGVSAMILVKGDLGTPTETQPSGGTTTTQQPVDNTNWAVVIGIVAAVAVAAAAVVVILLKKK